MPRDFWEENRRASKEPPPPHPFLQTAALPQPFFCVSRGVKEKDAFAYWGA